MNAINKLAPYSHWFIRINLAGIFLYHGFGKFMAAEMMSKMMMMPIEMIYITGVMEVSGSLLVLWGGFGRDWATRLSGLLFSIVMIGAISMFHWPQWSFVANEAKPMGGMEFQLLVAMVGIYFLTKGNKIVSVEA